MATHVKLPKIGLTMERARIVDWMKREGETVEKGEPLYTFETEKVTNEIESPASGILQKILAPIGTEATVGQDLAVIVAPGEELEQITSESVTPTKEEVPVRDLTAREKSEEHDRVAISPFARALARQHGIDVSKLKGSGPGGRITKEDVLKAVASPAAGTLEVAQSLPFEGIRKTIADRLTQSYHTAVHVAVMTEVDMGAATKKRLDLLPNIEKSTGVKLTFTSLLVQAVAKSLRAHPIVNSRLDGDQIKIFKNVNIGVAVAIESGLIVPVIHDADKKSLEEMTLHLARATEKAKQGNLVLDEVSGGTFTITNLGMFGVHTFVPIINPPESAILAVGQIEDKPVVVNGQITVRPRMNLTMVFDHRIFDGAEAAKFLRTLKEEIEA
ncbi:MAG: dihydrolipoamide acetyltransferase family protein [Candidatus Bathyarchaeia archaeon]|jgi:pyruvate dehydrogenase E2 component (dihydrolipoamide acetyltransferase)